MKKINALVKSIYKIVPATVFCLSFVSSLAQDVEIKAARKLLDEDKKKAAIEAFKKAISTYPEAAQLYYYLGHAQILAGDKIGAKASFDAGVTKNAKEPLNYVGLGHLLILEKNVAQAKVQFEKALGLGKKNIASLNGIGEAYLADKAYQKDAMDILQKSKSYNQKNSQTFLLIGDAHSLVLGQGGAAASAYESAYEVDQACAAAEFKLGELFMSTNLPVAEEHYQKAVAIDPKFAHAHRELGELYYKKKDGANAVKHYKTYLDLTDSPEKDDRFRYAFFLFLAREFDKANVEFEELSKKADVSSTVLKFYAQSLLKSNNLAKSEEIFEKYLKHSQTKVDADDYKNLGDLRIKQGKDSLAAIAYQQSVSMDSNQPDLHKTLINYYYNGKKYNEASKACRASIKSSKKPLANDFFTLGRSLFYEKKYVQADSAFANLIDQQPKFTSGYWWAARSKSAQDCDYTDPKCKIEWLAKPYYEKLTEVGDPTKDKVQVIEGYRYLVGYYLSKQDFQNGKIYLEKILVVDPQNEDAKQALKDINNPQSQQKPKRN